MNASCKSNIEPMYLRTFAHLVNCEAEYEHDGKYGVTIYEPLLRCDEPSDTKPHCYLANNIDFWSADGRTKLGHYNHHNLMEPFGVLVLLSDGLWYRIGSGRCEFVHGQWCMVWSAARNDSQALMMNAGFWAYRHYMPIRWLVRNIYSRVRWAIIERLSKFDLALQRRGWRER